MKGNDMTSHDDLEVRVAEALTGEGPLDAALQAHLAACESCADLARALTTLAGDAASGEPSEAQWLAFDAGLRERLSAAGAPSARRRRTWTLVALAAAIGALAFALWSRGAADDSAPAQAMNAGQAAGVLAAASKDSLELGLVDLGISLAEDDAVAEDPTPLAEPAGGPAPSWGDAVGEMVEELAALDPDAQQALVRALKEAS